VERDVTELGLGFDLGLDLGTVVEVLLRAVAVVAAFLVLPLVVGQTEHKVMAHMQSRLGPMYAGGFHGWAQLVADGVKFAQKEEIVPSAADEGVYRLAPAVALVPYMVAMAAIPLSPTWVAADLDAGLLFVLAISAIGVLGTLMAGWASANKYALLGAMRSAAQLLSYELPIVLAASSVAMAAGTLSLVGIAQAWQPWWLLSQAPAGFVFLIAGLAEIQRPPFDMPIADSELVVGPYTEYSGLRFALFLLAEYAGLVVLAGMTTVLFLGGWRGPASGVLGPLWSLLKIGAVSVLVIWVRVSWPRLREDQLQRLAWGVLVPVALAQLALTAVLVVATR
jgi:NADH-quinone oxidoreductase subunit H